MSLSFLSDDDRAILLHAQHNRLREYFPELQTCLLETTSDDRLLVYCGDPMAIAPVTADLDSFQHFVRLVVGLTAITFYHAGVILFHTGELQALAPETAGSQCNNLLFLGDGDMAPTTLQREQTEAKTPARTTTNSAAAIAPAIALSEIAADLKQPIDTVRQWFVEARINVLGYMEHELVAASDAQVAYDHFGPMLLQQRVSNGVVPMEPSTRNGSVKSGAIASLDAATEAPTEAASETRKPGRRAGSRPAKPAASRTKASEKKPTAKKPAAKTKA